MEMASLYHNFVKIEEISVSFASEFGFAGNGKFNKNFKKKQVAQTMQIPSQDSI